MFSKEILEASFHNFTEKKKVITFENGFRFTVVPEVLDEKTTLFHLKDFKGKFEEIKNYCYLLDFHISSEFEFKEVDHVKIEYQLQFPASKLQLLDLYECYPFVIKLPGYEHLKFRCVIKKFKRNEVTVVIENLYDLRLNGKKTEFKYEHKHLKSDIDINLTFIFDPATVIKPSKQNPLTNEDTFVSKLSLQNITSDLQYSDIVFISSDKKQIHSYKCIIAKHSKILAKTFENVTNNPVKIIADKYDAKTITAALNFCHGKNVSFKEMESLMTEIFKFAFEFHFDELKVCIIPFITN
uniref:BTB domain-containing protein n=1 Tax=Panagrolaimus superbus TaxID=310955 RepID=A0A914YJ90_9BILA